MIEKLSQLSKTKTRKVFPLVCFVIYGVLLSDFTSTLQLAAQSENGMLGSAFLHSIPYRAATHTVKEIFYCEIFLRMLIYTQIAKVEV